MRHHALDETHLFRDSLYEACSELLVKLLTEGIRPPSQGGGAVTRQAPAEGAKCARETWMTCSQAPGLTGLAVGAVCLPEQDCNPLGSGSAVVRAAGASRALSFGCYGRSQVRKR